VAAAFMALRPGSYGKQATSAVTRFAANMLAFSHQNLYLRRREAVRITRACR
jgi:hypothetical protein